MNIVINHKRYSSPFYLNTFVFLLFIVCHSVISYFHEPWFDEAQAWQIAKCASIKEILFYIPHYEGHPPLWHLLLLFPAKANIPFEIGIKSIGGLISVLNAYIFIFKSHLPRIIRLTIPFTYFFFYQYGIIVRPYGLMLMIMMLIGMNLKKWNNNPRMIVFLLCALCLVSAYGIVIAAGIAICLTWEIVTEKGLLRSLKELMKDARTRSLFVLFLLAVCLLLIIYPSPDAYAFTYQGEAPVLLKLICAFFTFPVECFLSTSSWFRTERVSMNLINPPIVEFAVFLFLGGFLLFLVLCISSKKRFKYFAVPYLIFCFFSAVVYFSTHHIGVVFLLVLSWMEFMSREEDPFAFGRHFLSQKCFSAKDRSLLAKTYKYIVVVCIVIPLYWSLSAVILEIQYDYCFARAMAVFIKENNLDDLMILGNWNEDASELDNGNYATYVNPYVSGVGVPLNAYFDHNIIFNFNDGDDHKAYVLHKKANFAESYEKIEEWKCRGVPEMIIGRPKLEDVYGDELSYKEYTCIYRKNNNFIWKDKVQKSVSLIYLRNDIFAAKDLCEVDDSDIQYRMDGFTITSEMREQYESGVPVEEILDPYFKIIFKE